MNPPTSIKVQIDSFLESVEQVKSHLASTIPLAPDSEQKIMMEELLATIDKEKLEFETRIPAALQEAKEKHEKTMAKFHELIIQKQQLQERIAQLSGKIEQAKKTISEKGEESKLKPKAIPLRPAKASIPDGEPQLSSGDILREMLLSPEWNKDTNGPSQPGIGNIWEKWNPNI